MSAEPPDAPPKELTGKEIAEKLAAIGGGKAAPSGEAIDAATRAELERWFGLPSYTQIAEGDIPKAKVEAPRPEDPDMVKAREKRQKAIAAVDPKLIDAIHARFDRQAAPFRELPPVELHLRDDVAQVDLDAIERAYRIAEPREVEMPPEMEDDLKECTPQALLRDLHRAELFFDKTFEVVDMAADQKMDIVAVVKEAMTTSWHLTHADLTDSPHRQATRDIAELRGERRDIPWPKLWTARPLPNRKVSE